jgi:DNA-binding LacI/PurR family transcriptional regulator
LHHAFAYKKLKNSIAMPKKIPTIKEIAKELSISVSTVSRALHDHPSIGLRTKTRVKELAEKLGYEPNQTAIFFKASKTFTVGVILPELAEEFFSKAISGIEDIAMKYNYTVLLGQSHGRVENEKRIITTMKNHRVDGLIVSISKTTINYEHFDMLHRYDIPIVFFDCIPNIPNIHYVECDMVDGSVKAVNFILKNKHRVIGLINGPEKLLASQQRLRGYRIAIEKHRLKFDPNLVLSTDLTANSTRKAMTELLSYKRKPTAILIFNDYVALDAVQYAREKNIRINKDLCLVSYANLHFNHYAAFPPLASLEQFPYEQGAKAMETLLKILNENHVESDTPEFYTTVIKPELVINKMSKPFQVK